MESEAETDKVEQKGIYKWNKQTSFSLNSDIFIRQYCLCV